MRSWRLAGAERMAESETVRSSFYLWKIVFGSALASAVRRRFDSPTDRFNYGSIESNNSWHGTAGIWRLDLLHEDCGNGVCARNQHASSRVAGRGGRTDSQFAAPRRFYRPVAQ